MHTLPRIMGRSRPNVIGFGAVWVLAAGPISEAAPAGTLEGRDLIVDQAMNAQASDPTEPLPPTGEAVLAAPAASAGGGGAALDPLLDTGAAAVSDGPASVSDGPASASGAGSEADAAHSSSGVGSEADAAHSSLHAHLADALSGLLISQALARALSEAASSAAHALFHSASEADGARFSSDQQTALELFHTQLTDDLDALQEAAEKRRHPLTSEQHDLFHEVLSASGASSSPLHTKVDEDRRNLTGPERAVLSGYLEVYEAQQDSSLHAAQAAEAAAFNTEQAASHEAFHAAQAAEAAAVQANQQAALDTLLAQQAAEHDAFHAASGEPDTTPVPVPDVTPVPEPASPTLEPLAPVSPPTDP